jgi:hypothetical protein
MIAIGAGIVALVLAAAGGAKLVSPSSFGQTATALGFRVGPLGARLVGIGELVCAALAVAWWRPAIALMCPLYLGFAWAAWRAERAGAASCGCFGAVEAPPSGVHVVVNLASAAVAIAAVTTRAAAPPLIAWPVIALGAVLVITALTVGAEVIGGIRQVAGHTHTFRSHAEASEVARS